MAILTLPKLSSEATERMFSSPPSGLVLLLTALSQAGFGVPAPASGLDSSELPGLGEGVAMLDAYLATLERLHPLVSAAEHVVPGHGPVLDREAALSVLDEDLAYLQALRERRAEVELPARRRSKVQRELHEQNLMRIRI